MKVAVVGAGGISSLVHIPVWKRVPGVEIAGIFDTDIQRSSAIARQRSIPRVYNSLEELLRDRVDLVDVCTPPNSHAPIIQQALTAGKNVLTEKPLATDSKAAADLVEFAKKKALVLGVNQNHLYSKSIRELSKLISEGTLGELLQLTITFPLSVYHADHWTSNPKTGGFLFELGIHPSYMATFLFGSAEKVDAFGNIPSAQHPFGALTIVVRKADSVCSIILSPFEDQPTIRAFGSEAAVIVNLHADTIIYDVRRMKREREPFGRYGSFKRNGLSLAGNWLGYSGAISLGYITRGIRFIASGHTELNQFTCFQNVTQIIAEKDLELKKDNERYLDVAVDSIRLLERVRECVQAPGTMAVPHGQ